MKTPALPELVTQGINWTLRHPAYLGLLYLFLGIPLSLWSHGGLAITLLGGVPAVIHRIRIEEAALQDWFGDTNLEYGQNTWRIIPYIW